ncbi:ELWxxDGT repeat protein [Rhodovastum atsumiense]
MVKDINPGGHDSVSDEIVALGNGTAVFAAWDFSRGIELWAMNGTASGTTAVKRINPDMGAELPRLESTGDGRALFWGKDSPAQHWYEHRIVQPWITDGTSAGTHVIKENAPELKYPFNPKAEGSGENGRAVFVADDGTHGYEPWVSDGTSAGTHMVVDLRPGTAGSEPMGFVSNGSGKTMFSADDGVHGRGAWVTDGTAAGTCMLKDMSSGENVHALGWDFDSVAIGGGLVLFNAADPAGHRSPWITDGTSVGTHLLRHFVPGSDGAESGNYAAAPSPAPGASH